MTHLSYTPRPPGPSVFVIRSGAFSGLAGRVKKGRPGKMHILHARAAKIDTCVTELRGWLKGLAAFALVEAKPRLYGSVERRAVVRYYPPTRRRLQQCCNRPRGAQSRARMRATFLYSKQLQLWWNTRRFRSLVAVIKETKSPSHSLVPRGRPRHGRPLLLWWNTHLFRSMLHNAEQAGRKLLPYL